MRRLIIAILVIAVGVIPWPMAPGLFASQAKPRSQPDPPRAEEPRRPAGDQPAARQEPREGPRQTPAEAPEGRQAKPREPAAAPERQGGPRRIAPPPRAVPPPQYYRAPRVYYFPPVSLQRGFYYHPYFGFYYGPYYGPYYPHPGPVVGPSRYSASAIRTRVRPVEAEVWVNGYFAGVADDFDGVFQRLYLPAGEHVIEFHLDGYRNVRQKLYLQPGDTREITIQLLRIGPGDLHETPLTPRALPDEWATRSDAPAGDRPASPFGILALTIEPADAQIVIDGEVWLGTAERTELVIHVPSGWHELEVRKDGYQTFRTRMELSEGGTMRLGVRLVR